MTAKTKTKSHENPRHESQITPEKKQIDNKLDRELADSFPASDPPSLTQPAFKPGGPERNRSRSK